MHGWSSHEKESTDVLVVGGGFSGITVAAHLAKTGLKVMVVDADGFGYQATGQAGAMLIPADMASSGENGMRDDAILDAAVRTRGKAIEAISAITRAYVLDVNLCKTELYDRKDQIGKRENALLIEKCLVLDPVQYYQALLNEVKEAKNVILKEGLRVAEVGIDRVFTEGGFICAKYIVIATGFPIVNAFGFTHGKIIQKRIYTLRCKTKQVESNGIATYDGNFTAFRFKDSVVVRIAVDDIGRKDDNNLFDELRHSTDAIGAESVTVVSICFECYTTDRRPYIGMLSSELPNTFVAAGYDGNGIVGGMMAAQMIADRITGKNTQDYEIYSPQRRGLTIRSSIKYGARTLLNMMGTAQAPRCSHMGCGLHFNRNTRLWECPWHGSCFDDNGFVCNAPAVFMTEVYRKK